MMIKFHVYKLGFLLSALVALFFIFRELFLNFNNYYIVIAVLVILLGYFIYKSLRLVGTVQRLEGFIIGMRRYATDASNELKKIDASGAYESNDETGFYMKMLKTIQEDIDVFLGVKSSEKK